ncbi:medium-chain fatty acid-CoA ligase faa2 [Polyrhizophydium stewartii]|uniref:Long-chain-fatty-acid--CoA ligase n=1 Tax=Polyrhizophydium stewartii TaxID=2732419 RepID=A0ABR4MXK1_9FUNG
MSAFGAEFDSLSAALLAGVASVTLWSTLTSHEPDVHPAVLREQSLVSRTRNPGETGIYRCKLTPHGTPLHDNSNGFRTAYDGFWSAVAKYGDRPYVGYRIGDGPYIWISYKALGDRVTRAGAGLVRFGGLRPLEPVGSDPVATNFVGILLKNCPEWLITDYAAISNGLVSVPIHETFDGNSIAYILNHTEMKLIVAGAPHLDRILAVLPSCKHLKQIVVVSSTPVPEDKIAQAKAAGVQIKLFSEIESLGAENPVEMRQPNPLDIFTISYTSGTTGSPKGAMIRHESIMAGGAGLLNTLPKELAVTEKDRHISYLPMSHMLERIITQNLGILGCQIGFFRGDITQLFDDIAVLKPTIFPTVPRLLNRLYDRVTSTVNKAGFIGKALFQTAYASKKKMLERGFVSRTTMWDYLVFGKIQARIGGHVRAFVTGAAPISPDVLQFVRIVFGVNILEGYGQTESCSTGLVTLPGDYLSPYGSHVGAPFSSCEYKLIDVPVMDYRVTDPNPRGEAFGQLSQLLLRGPTMMRGYYKDPVKTAETIDKDGWLHTGDVGEVLPNGTLKIIDRVKNIFKLSQGEYIAPETIELAVATKYLAQIFVHGDSLQSCLIVIGFPDPEELLPWAAQNGHAGKSLEQLCQEPAVKKMILDEIIAAGRRTKLVGYEIPKAIHLVPEQMSVDNGLLTPTFKTKRFEARKRFEAEIKALYASLS